MDLKFRASFSYRVAMLRKGFESGKEVFDQMAELISVHEKLT
jgi:hypothetical protein